MQKIITEGSTLLKVYEKSFENVSKKTASVFFNPVMKLNRDITVAVVRSLEDVRFLDLLAATGVKGLRVAREARAEEVALNDINSGAVKLIKENAELNTLDVEVYNSEANLLLNEIKDRFNFIDIDPFGTPVPFIDNAIRRVSNKGVVGITATDTAPLCGVYPKVTIRRYLAMPLRGELCKETGLRILLGYSARTAAKYDRAISPLLCHSTGHYFRCFLKVVRGAKKADISIKNLGYLYFCTKCRNFEVEKSMFPVKRECCSREMSIAGPLWLGKLKEQDFVEIALRNSHDLSSEAKKLLEIIVQEEEIPFYYDIHSLGSIMNIGNLPKIDYIIEQAKKKGYHATRTHIIPTAIKTDLPEKEISDILRSYR